MTTNLATSFASGLSTSCPPLFDGTGYSMWKNRMRVFLQSRGFEIWSMVENEYIKPTSPSNTWSPEECRAQTINAKAMYSIFCALTPCEYNRVSTCESAYQIWKTLEVTHEGTSQVRETRVNMLTCEYELFKMLPNENISDMFARFTNIINSLISLGKKHSNEELVRKILRSLPKAWGPKVEAIEESKDLSKLTMDQLIGSLLTYELKTKAHEAEEEAPKSKIIAHKASIRNASNGKEESDEEIAFLTQKFMRHLAKKEEATKSKKLGHKKGKCPLNHHQGKKGKKKSLMTNWDESEASSFSSSSSEDTKKECVNLCLMAINDEVSSNSSCSNRSSNFDLQEEYDNLLNEFQSLASKYTSLKKEKSLLVKEKDALKLSHESLKIEKNVLNSHVSALSNSLKILRNEVQNLNLKLKGFKNISTQRNLKRKSNEFSKSHDNDVKRKFPKFHSHSHTFHATPNFNGNCFYCGLHGHRISDCIYKGDSKIDNAFWIPKLSNSHGPKAIWVPKSLPSSFVGGGFLCK